MGIGGRDGGVRIVGNKIGWSWRAVDVCDAFEYRC